MTAGNRYSLPGGHEGIEVEGSTRDVLRVCVIVPNWPFPKPPQTVPRSLCTLLPSRYLKGAVPAEDYPEALL
jgi:hypothetical protein